MGVMKKLFFAFLASLLVFIMCGCTERTQNNQTDYLSALEEELRNSEGKDHIPSSNIETNLTNKTLSEEDLAAIRSYVEYGSSGVKLVSRTNSFESGWLELTITQCIRITHLEDMATPSTGFLYEACLGRDENDRWKEYSRPPCILDDGAFKEGWALILLNVSVSSHDARMRTDAPGYYNDPYLFRADSLLWLADTRYKEFSNYVAYSIDYINTKGQYKEHECCFRLAPGQTEMIEVGFLVGPDMLNGQCDYSQFKICNTTGHEESVFIDLTLGGT